MIHPDFGRPYDYDWDLAIIFIDIVPLTYVGETRPNMRKK